MATHVKRDYYEVLGVGRTANDQEIKSAYRKLAMQYHPDRNPGNPDAEEKFKEASEAYSILADTEKRARYDRFGHAGVGNGAGAASFDPTIFQDFNDILGDFFGFGDFFGGGSRRGSRAQRGSDIRADLELTFEEVIFGKKTEITIHRQEVCDKCRGSGAAAGKTAVPCSNCGGRGQVRYQQGFFSVARTCGACGGAGEVIKDPCERCKGEGRVERERKIQVAVPPGVEDQTRIRYQEQGDAGANGGPAGDLYVVLNVGEHAYFHRDGTDLHCAIPISFPQATLGAEITVPTLDKQEGGECKLKIPEGTQHGKQLRIKGRGVPVLNGRGRGDLVVHIQIRTPTRLSKRQRELLEELELLGKVENRPESKSLIRKVKDIFA